MKAFKCTKFGENVQANLLKWQKTFWGNQRIANGKEPTRTLAQEVRPTHQREKWLWAMAIPKSKKADECKKITRFFGKVLPNFNQFSDFCGGPIVRPGGKLKQINAVSNGVTVLVKSVPKNSIVPHFRGLYR